MRDLQAGDVLRGRYEIQRLLSPARDKRVYLAHDRTFDRLVAVDVFSNNDPIVPGGLTVSAWEARVLGQLDDHQNIATVLDHWEDSDSAVMVSRYLSRGSLRDVILDSHAAGHEIPTERILEIALQIARGLEHIHSRGILYRDLQPRNVLFDEWENVHLVDFDTAVPLDEPEMSDLSGRLIIEYMAPELTRGENADERADLYSLGATIYEMCTGNPPYGGIREEILAPRSSGHLEDIARTDIPPALAGLVSSMLASAREHRPTSASEVVERLEVLRSARADIERLLSGDETATLEFKSSLRTPVGAPLQGDRRPPGEISKALELEVLKTLAAFLNTDGGTLIIGVTDSRKSTENGERTVIGIEVDYPRTKGSSDGWCLTFDDLVSKQLGAEVMNYVDLGLETLRGRTVAIVQCRPCDEPVWIDDELFVRRTASTEKLTTRHALAWCRRRWGSVGALASTLTDSAEAIM